MGPAPSRISAPTRPFAAAPARSPQRARKGEEPKNGTALCCRRQPRLQHLVAALQHLVVGAKVAGPVREAPTPPHGVRASLPRAAWLFVLAVAAAATVVVALYLPGAARQL